MLSELSFPSSLSLHVNRTEPNYFRTFSSALITTCNCVILHLSSLWISQSLATTTIIMNDLSWYVIVVVIWSLLYFVMSLRGLYMYKLIKIENCNCIYLKIDCLEYTFYIGNIRCIGNVIKIPNGVKIKYNL